MFSVQATVSWSPLLSVVAVNRFSQTRTPVCFTDASKRPAACSAVSVVDAVKALVCVKFVADVVCAYDPPARATPPKLYSPRVIDAAASVVVSVPQQMRVAVVFVAVLAAEAAFVLFVSAIHFATA